MNRLTVTVEREFKLQRNRDYNTNRRKGIPNWDLENEFSRSDFSGFKKKNKKYNTEKEREYK